VKLKIDVTFKDIKNVYLSVYPPPKVRISASIASRFWILSNLCHFKTRLDKKATSQALMNKRESQPGDYISREKSLLLGYKIFIENSGD
jgi:hypothetical protein